MHNRIALTANGHLVVQMLNRYLVMETDEGIALIDQHALHERILYEQMKERLSTGQLPSQRLLVPVPVDLSPNEFSCVQENSGFFGTLGMSVEPFGGNTVLISAFPAALSKTLPEEILLSLVEPMLERGKKLEKDELLDELLHRLACKAAVKAGEKLSSDSMRHLIQLATEEINAHHCPHGRPSTLVFTKEEIDKMFDRT
jgi:DNA mismatch repair protein MutL